MDKSVLNIINDNSISNSIGFLLPRGKQRKNKAALEEMHNKRIAKRRRRRFLFGRS